MRKNIYERIDSYWNIFGNSEESVFSTPGQIIETDIPRIDNSNILFELRFTADVFENRSKREVFNILDFLGSIGGILEILKGILEIIL